VTIAQELRDRAAYIKGLRTLADLLEAAPGLELPDTGSGPASGLDWNFLRNETDEVWREELARLARVEGVLPCKWDREVSGDYIWVRGQIHGLWVELTARSSGPAVFCPACGALLPAHDPQCPVPVLGEV
jgi:hypothetical protein